MKSKVSKTKAKSSKSSKSGKESDIVSLILKDHLPIKKLISILKNPEISISKKRPAYKEFESILSNHASAEQESLYIHLKKDEELRSEGHEGDIEHSIAFKFMEEIDQIKNDNDKWMAKVKVLAEVVDHHVKEEEKEVLKQVKKEFDLEERMEIGREYTQLLEQFREDHSPDRKHSGSSLLQVDYV